MTTNNPYRSLPSVDRLLADERIRGLGGASNGTVTDIVRRTLQSARATVEAGGTAPTEDQLVEAVLGLAETVFSPSLRPVINATGVIIHTNLGRAPLSDESIEAIAAVSRGYSNLEFDLSEGERGSRFTHLESVLQQLTGAEGAMAVNNNASALLLVLSTLSAGREVIVSRGQAVEIGGGFRIPDVLGQSGARIVEVGTTNRTYLRDYEAAITAETAAILRVHASNFRIVGFTEQPSIDDLAELARERRVLLIDDIGSGCLIDTTAYGMAHEPTVQESMAAGASLTLFSGDKLLGGPQAGIIVGRQDLVAQVRRHPLARAVRMDKAGIAALTATLLHYLRGEEFDKVPVLRMIAMPLADIEKRARRWTRAIGKPALVADGLSMVGGGSLPEQGLPTKAVAIPGDGGYVTNLASRLRLGDPPVIARVERDTLLLDPRTVSPLADQQLLEAVRRSLAA